MFVVCNDMKWSISTILIESELLHDIVRLIQNIAKMSKDIHTSFVSMNRKQKKIKILSDSFPLQTSHKK